MISLFDQTALEQRRHEHQIQPYRIRQIMHEVFDNAVIDFNEMTVLPKDLRELLSKEIQIIPFELDSMREDDETSKFLFKSDADNIFEAVIMYHQGIDVVNGESKLNRMTLCISSQVGCNVGCIFCVTGKMGLKKNLTSAEILGQVLYANHYIKQKCGKKPD
jgi:23S rRNA (adenine2503-C2)-methyltransferase